MIEDKVCALIMFFNRLPGLWWLSGESLRHWVTHRKVKEPIEVSVTCNENQYKEYCYGRTVPNAKINFNQKTDNNIIATKEEKDRLRFRNDLSNDGLWRKNISIVSPYMVQLPFKYGTVLDNWKPLWWIGDDKGEDPTKKENTWFTHERKQNAYELIGLMYQCADRAGMRDAMFLGFGGLLGYVMYGDICKNDDDIDMCIIRELSTKEKDLRYLEEIKKPIQIGKKRFPHGLCENMYRFSNNSDDGRPVWFSVGHRSIMRDNGVKSCHWWMFEHSNHYWHSKGERWVTNAKIPGFQINKTDKAICLGQPSGTLKAFTEVNLKGVAVNMPVKAGTCCDWWYPGWMPDGKGSSAHKRILAIPEWSKKSTWRMG